MEKAKMKIFSDLSLYIVFHGAQNIPDVNVLILKFLFCGYIHTYIHNLFGKEGFKKRSRGLMWTYYLK